MQDTTLSPSPARAGLLDRGLSTGVMPWFRLAAAGAAIVTSSRRTRDEPTRADRPLGTPAPRDARPDSGTTAPRGGLGDSHARPDTGDAMPQPGGCATPRTARAGGGPGSRLRGVEPDPIDVLSHELRSPMTTIHLGTKVLRSRRKVTERVREAVVEAVEAEAERLFRLVEDLLVIARHDGGRHPLPVQPLLLQRTLPPLLEAEARVHDGARIRVSLPHDLPPAIADEAALCHVVRNVIANAVRFAPPGSPVEVAAEARDGQIELRIADRGPGIDPEEADRLFEPFYRSARTAATIGGAGLGLTAARRLLAAMGGSIEARPRPGGGALFVVRFTRTDPAPEP